MLCKLGFVLSTPYYEADIPDVESLRLTAKLWRESVWERCRGQCSNCGSSENLRVKMLVPIAAGGVLIDSNGTLICRTCELAADAIAVGKDTSDTRLINFWMSTALHSRLRLMVGEGKDFPSLGALIRFMMAQFVRAPEIYQDLELYQDRECDVRVNVWVENRLYTLFRQKASASGDTVTSTIKSLLMAFEVEFAKRSKEGQTNVVSG